MMQLVNGNGAALPEREKSRMQRISQILALLLAFVATTGEAQDKLMKLLLVDSASVAWKENRPQALFFDKEKARLLMPEGAAFGVECIPSFSTEWMLTYDSISCALTYKEVEKSLWKTTYNAWYKRKKVWGKRHHHRWVQRRHPKDYEAPAVKTYTIAVTPDRAEKLRAIWTSIIGAAEEGEVYSFDGTTWEYFINGKRAKTHSEQNSFVKFTNQLKEAVLKGDAPSINSTIDAEFQRVTSSPGNSPTLSEN